MDGEFLLKFRIGNVRKYLEKSIYFLNRPKISGTLHYIKVFFIITHNINHQKISVCRGSVISFVILAENV